MSFPITDRLNGVGIISGAVVTAMLQVKSGKFDLFEFFINEY